eukprot:3005445-Amphidinium_carterae.1
MLSSTAKRLERSMLPRGALVAQFQAAAHALQFTVLCGHKRSKCYGQLTIGYPGLPCISGFAKYETKCEALRGLTTQHPTM